MKIPKLKLDAGMAIPFATLSAWRSARQRASVQALVILIVMLVLSALLGTGQAPGAPFAIVCLGAALAWVVGVRLVGLELALLVLARRHRVAAEALRTRLAVLAVLAFACEAAAAAGITGLLFAGSLHPLAVLLTLEFAALALLWNQLMVSRGTVRLAVELAPLLPAEAVPAEAGN